MWLFSICIGTAQSTMQTSMLSICVRIPISRIEREVPKIKVLYYNEGI